MTVATEADYDVGPLIDGDHHYALLEHVLNLGPKGIALEFGVGSGQSTRLIASHMPVIGFDSFEGLPEDWRPGYPQGTFACDAPDIPGASIVKGLFADTLKINLHSARAAGLIHIDCDLYSSTKTVLETLYAERRHLVPGTFVVFDEWHGYDGCELHEQRAWRELAETTGIRWKVIGHGHHEAWSIQIV